MPITWISIVSTAALFVCLTSTIRLLASASSLGFEDARYESSQRLWYPRGAFDGEAFSRFRQPQQASARLSRQKLPVGLKGPSMVSRARSTPSVFEYQNMSSNRLNELDKRGVKYVYMMSPLNEQILEIGSQNKMLDGSIEWPKQWAQQESESHLANSKPASPKLSDPDECQTISSPVLITRDDIDKMTGLLVRNCKGLIKLNKCEGSCGSFVQPSIKSPTGLKKECSCCNEGSFRRIQVRLTECYWALENRLITSGEDQQRSYMDIGLEEPMDCRCRRCDSFV